MEKRDKQIEEAKNLLIQATKLLSEAIEGDQAITTEEKIEDWMKDRIELWCRIYNDGGLVTNERLHEIWKSMGKDVRGLGGFFTGKNSSLQYAHDKKVILTRNASETLEAWTGKTIETYAVRFKKGK